jgi:hypothetical protein
VALCAILSKVHLIETGTSSHNAAVAQAQNAGTAPVTIVAPEFCKDQTWPYIDSRCLRRVAPDTPQATVPPATTTAAAPAPSGGSAKTVAATPPTAETSGTGRSGAESDGHARSRYAVPGHAVRVPSRRCTGH